ncbi:MAG: hypothetical protein QOG50_333 [Actinomycetota bacterium]|nr:hypothetical protein [Actinomycetota bacterium]
MSDDEPSDDPVNPVAIWALIVAAAFALGDWVACSRDTSSAAGRRLEYVCKPAALLALVVAAATLDPAAGADTRQRWFVAALVFSLAGDVLLMLPTDQFVGGLSAFFVAHCCYLAGFWSRGPALVPLLVSVAIAAVVVGFLGKRILTALRVQDRALIGPVAAYMLVIGAMLATALAVGNPLAAVGAVLFVTSDSMIAWNRFVGTVPNASVLIMITYHLGQAGLVASLLR